MALAILDSKFQLLSLLKGSANCQVYRGSNATGQPVLIKVLLDPDQFFDELARYFSLDHLENIAFLYANYPPVWVGGSGFLGDGSLLETIKFHQSIQDQNHSRVVLEETKIGILVIEWVEGKTVTDLWLQWENHHRFEFVAKMVEVISQIHGIGEYHGHIQPDHIMIDSKTGRLVLVGLGYYPGKPFSPEKTQAPEHAFRLDTGVSTATDIYLFAKHFLGELDLEDGNRLVLACSAIRPEKRCRIGKVQHQLAKLNYSPPPSSPNLAMIKWGLFSTLVFTLVFGWTNWFGADTTNLVPQTQVTAGLAQLLRETKWHQSTTQSGLTTPSTPLFDEYDLHRPIAILVFQRKVFLVGRKQIYVEGQQVFFRGENRRITQLSPCHIQLSQNDHHYDLLFDQPTDSPAPDASDAGVYIWDHPNNFVRFLTALAEIHHAFQPLPRGPTARFLDRIANVNDDRVTISEGNIRGSFRSGNFGSFLKHLDQLIHYQFKANTLHVSINGSQAIL